MTKTKGTGTSITSIKKRWFSSLDFEKLKDSTIETAKKFHIDPKRVMVCSRIRDGEEERVHCCHKCGHAWIVKGRRTASCPECGNSHYVFALSSSDIIIDRNYFRVAESEDAIVIALVTSFYSYNSNDDMTFKECVFSRANVQFALGTKNLELCFQSVDYNKPDTYTFRSSFNKQKISDMAALYGSWEELDVSAIEDTTFHNLQDWGYENIKKYFQAVDNKLNRERIERRNAARVEKTLVVEDMPLPDVESVNKFLTDRNHHMLIGKLINSDMHGHDEFRYTCSCGFDKMVDHRLYKCLNDETNPHEGSKTILEDTWNFLKVELDQEKNFVWRHFKYEVEFENCNPVKTISEVARLTLLPTKKFQATKKEMIGTWKSIKPGKLISEFSYLRNQVGVMISEEVENFYDQSLLKYSGCKEYWEENPNTRWSIHPSEYLMTWINNPCIEQIYKVGLNRIASKFFGDSSTPPCGFNPDGTTIYDILEINKPILRIAKELDVSYMALQTIKKLWAADQTINAENIKEFKELPEYRNGRYEDFYVSGLNIATKIITDWHIRFKDVIEYIHNVYNYQCIIPGETLSIWNDYLEMCHLMKLHLSHSRKFPSSLKKEHDKMVFAYRAVKEQIDRELFVSAIESNRYLEKTPPSKELFIKIPSAPEEVVDEGNQQSHCVASYVNKIKDANSIVLFLRRKEDPEHSYFTIEITPNKELIQCKGKGNCMLKDPDAIRFIKQWAEMHEITLSTRDLP